MATYSDPPSPSLNENSTPRLGMPYPPEREKKSNKKLETPVLVAIISAVVTLITSILGSPLLISLVNKAASPAPTSTAALVISYNSPLPTNPPEDKLLKATLDPTESGTDIIEFTSTPLGEYPTSAPLPLESTFTSTPTAPKEPEPPSREAPSVVQCIEADLWFPYPTTSSLDMSDSCWDLAEWGFSSDQGRLLLAHKAVQDQQRGIYTPISGDVDIRFDVQLNDFRTRSNKVGFLNFGIVQNDPISIYKGGFLSYQQPSPGTASPVRVLISGNKQATQKISALETGFQHEVLISVVNDLMTVNLNGEQTGDPVSLPPTDRAFWIGYVLPSKGELEMTITNFTIEAR